MWFWCLCYFQIKTNCVYFEKHTKTNCISNTQVSMFSCVGIDRPPNRPTITNLGVIVDIKQWNNSTAIWQKGRFVEWKQVGKYYESLICTLITLCEQPGTRTTHLGLYCGWFRSHVYLFHSLYVKCDLQKRLTPFTLITSIVEKSYKNPCNNISLRKKPVSGDVEMNYMYFVKVCKEILMVNSVPGSITRTCIHTGVHNSTEEKACWLVVSE